MYPQEGVTPLSEEFPKIKLPEMDKEISLTSGGVTVPINVGKVRTHEGLTARIQSLVKNGLGDDFSGRIRIGAIRGVVPNKVSIVLIFATPNELGGHDLHIDVPRNKH